jgi:ABC-2 type transport system permease protein
MSETVASLRRIGAVLVKELRQLRRDRPTLAMMVMIPIMQLFLFGTAINTDPKHLPTALLVGDNGPLARGLLTGLANSGYFAFDRPAVSEAEARALLQTGAVQFVVALPENFTRDVIRGDRPAIRIDADATDPTASANALASLAGIVERVGNAELKGPLAAYRARAAGFAIETHRLYNPEGSSALNIVPGLVGTMLTMTGMMMTALALTRERERGTMENLLAMPIHPIEVMVGKIAPYLAIGYVQAGIILAAAVWAFDVPMLGSLALLAGVLLIFITANLALGFAISAAARNQTQALQLSLFLFLPSVLLTGFMFPFRGMPVWAQTLGSVLPNTYFIRIVRGVMLKGNGIAEIAPNLGPLALLTLTLGAMALSFYRRTLD